MPVDFNLCHSKILQKMFCKTLHGHADTSYVQDLNPSSVVGLHVNHSVGRTLSVGLPSSNI